MNENIEDVSILKNSDQNLKQENSKLFFAVIGAVMGVLIAYFISNLKFEKIWWQKILPNISLDPFFLTALVFAIILALIGYFSAGLFLKRKNKNEQMVLQSEKEKLFFKNIESTDKTETKNEEKRNMDSIQKSSFKEEALTKEISLKDEKKLSTKKAWEKEDKSIKELVRIEQEHFVVPRTPVDQTSLIESTITRVKEEILKELSQIQWAQSEENTEMRFLFRFLSDSIKKLENIDACCKEFPENISKIRSGVVMLIHNLSNENLKLETEELNKIIKILDYIDDALERVLNEIFDLSKKINLLMVEEV